MVSQIDVYKRQPTTRVQQLTRNVLNSDVEVIGSLRFSDDLLMDGTVEGDILSLIHIFPIPKTSSLMMLWKTSHGRHPSISATRYALSLIHI